MPGLPLGNTAGVPSAAARSVRSAWTWKTRWTHCWRLRSTDGFVHSAQIQMAREAYSWVICVLSGQYSIVDIFVRGFHQESEYHWCLNGGYSTSYGMLWLCGICHPSSQRRWLMLQVSTNRFNGQYTIFIYLLSICPPWWTDKWI